MTPKIVTLLLVEDDAVDVMAIERAFRQQKIANPIVLAKNGVEALEHLRGTNGRTKLPRPHLILLDLNMPRMNGLELLGVLRADPELHPAVVFVLTTSKTDEDMVAAYGYNVAGYVVKAEAGMDFVRLIALLDAYWRIVEMP